MTKKSDDGRSDGKHGNHSDEPRRRLLKTVAASGTVLGLTTLPGKWGKPIVASVVLPAHAQFSQACCDLVPVGDFTYPGSNSIVFASVTNQFNGISVTNGTLDGAASTTLLQPSTVPCPPGCDGVQRKYASASISFGGGNKYALIDAYALCGDAPIAHYHVEINESSVDNSNGTGYYTGSISFQEEVCDGVTLDRARGRFQFGG